MTAPAESVAAVQEELGCWFEDTVAGVFCNKHHCYADQRHESIDVCEVAVAAADAAVQAARPSIERAAKAEALREFADNIDAMAAAMPQSKQWERNLVSGALTMGNDRTPARRPDRGPAVKWVIFRDTCSWHAGWFPTQGDERQFSIQHIYGWAWNLDVAWNDRNDWRIQWRQVGFREQLHLPHPGRGLRVENNAKEARP